MSKKNLIVGMTGASGAIFGVRMLEALRGTDVTTHLVISKWAKQTLEHETSLKLDDLKVLADAYYAPGEMGAKVSSGSFITDGMVIVPCSAKSLAAIANGLGEHLVHRVADVTLKERRPLVMVVRETPLNDIHLENMLKLSRMGVTILPPLPAFYNHPKSIDDIVNHLVGRVLDQFGIECGFEKRWDGSMNAQPPRSQQP